MVLKPKKILCRKAHKDLIPLKLTGKKIDSGLTVSTHLNKKKNRLVACFERGWLKRKARLDKIRRYTSFMERVNNGRTASKRSSGIFLSQRLKNEDET